MVKVEKKFMKTFEREVLVHARRRDGSTRLLFKHHNIITYQAAGIMARMTGGDAQYIPSKVGFVYAIKAAAGIVNPDVNRAQLWSTMSSTLKDPANKLLAMEYREIWHKDIENN